LNANWNIVFVFLNSTHKKINEKSNKSIVVKENENVEEMMILVDGEEGVSSHQFIVVLIRVRRMFHGHYCPLQVATRY
jgi:hypothetical protein